MQTIDAVAAAARVVAPGRAAIFIVEFGVSAVATTFFLTGRRGVA